MKISNSDARLIISALKEDAMENIGGLIDAHLTTPYEGPRKPMPGHAANVRRWISNANKYRKLITKLRTQLEQEEK